MVEICRVDRSGSLQFGRRSEGGAQTCRRSIAPWPLPYYGEDEVTALETHDPQKIWREGLEWISTESNRRWGKAFHRRSAGLAGRDSEVLE